MIILKIIGWMILALIALIIMALCVKVHIVAEYSEVDTHVQLGWLFLKVPLYPSKKKEKTEEKTEEAPPEEEKKEEKPAPAGESFLQTLYNSHGIDGIKELLSRTCSYLKTFMGKLLRSILIIDEFYVDVGCTRGDAAATAIYYGEVSSALFPMLGNIVSQCKVRKYNINIYPDYLARHSRSAFYVSLYMRPIYIIGITIALVFKLLFNVILKMFIKITKYNKTKPQAPGNSENKQGSEKVNVSQVSEQGNTNPAA